MIAVEEYFDKLFSTAAGWLGWSPEVILNTNICQIELAIEGKIDFVKKTNPWGQSEEEKSEDELLNAPPDPEKAMKKLLQFVKKRQETDKRNTTVNKKKRKSIAAARAAMNLT